MVSINKDAPVLARAEIELMQIRDSVERSDRF